MRTRELTSEDGEGEHEHDVDEDDPAADHRKRNPHPEPCMPEVVHVQDARPQWLIGHVGVGLLPSLCTASTPSRQS